MAPTDRALHRAAERLAEAFTQGGVLASRESAAQLENRMFEALRANFQKEMAIERDAERILEENRRQTSGMDQRTLFLKIKERLARERSFVL